jgi:hypothetical protein
MKIVSIDVGIKNLAICIIDEKLEIYEWKIVDISSNDKKASIEVLANNIYTGLDTVSDSWTGIDHVLIENQPVLKNPTMKTVQVLVYGYFHSLKMKGVPLSVQFISAKSKLTVANVIKCTKYKSNYTNNKMSSVLTTLEYLKDHPKRDFFVGIKKKDDLSDCFLQAVYFIQNKC